MASGGGPGSWLSRLTSPRSSAEKPRPPRAEGGEPGVSGREEAAEAGGARVPSLPENSVLSPSQAGVGTVEHMYREHAEELAQRLERRRSLELPRSGVRARELSWGT